MTKEQAMIEVLKMQRNQAFDAVVELNGKLVELDTELQQLKQQQAQKSE